MDVRGAEASARAIEHVWHQPAARSLSSETPLASLGASPLNKRFCAWHGASGRRYVTSVFGVDLEAEDAGLPAFDVFLLVAVARGPAGRRIASISLVERPSDRRTAMAAGLSRGAAEWHVHLLAADRGTRESVAADLRARHISGEPEARCA